MNATILLDHESLEPTTRTGRRSAVRALLRVSGEAPRDDARVPLNLALVLDRSGSMAGAKLEAARDAAATLVRRLWPEDVVSVVAYDTEVRTLAEPGRGSEHPELSRTLAGLRAGSCTNLSGGWLRGRELVERNRTEGGVSRILLLTDGLANEGITDPDALTGLCARARGEGITTTTLGFGEDYDEALLRAMADAGGGSAYYIEGPDSCPVPENSPAFVRRGIPSGVVASPRNSSAIPRRRSYPERRRDALGARRISGTGHRAADVFGEELEGLLSLSAQNLVVEVRPASAAELAVVHHSYPRTPTADGLRLELGDLYAREPRELLVELAVEVPDRGAAADGFEATPSPLPVAELLVQGDVLEDDGSVVHRQVALPITLVPGAGPRVEPEIRKRIVLLEAARARERALEAHRRGEAEEGGRYLREAAGRLERFVGEGGRDAGDAEELRGEARELIDLAARFDEEFVRESDAKYLYQSAYDALRVKEEHGPRRSSTSDLRSRRPPCRERAPCPGRCLGR